MAAPEGQVSMPISETGRSTDPKAGFTLIELVAAMTVLSILALALGTGNGAGSLRNRWLGGVAMRAPLNRNATGRRDRRMTLIELVIAIAILSIGMIAAWRGYEQAQRGIGGQVGRILAQEVALNRAAELRLSGLTEGFDIRLTRNPPWRAAGGGGAMRGARRSRGMALINALIVVTALAAVTLALLVRTQAALERLEMRFGADQAELYLDAAEQMALRLLEASARPEYVHAGQSWAIARSGDEIGTGRVGWQMDDLQGRFNVNWLAREGSMGEAARIALPLLARANGVPDGVATRMRNALDPRSLFRDSAFGGGAGVSAPPPLPLPLPLILPDTLRLVSGAGGDRLDRLMPHLTALPPDTSLNINTVSAGVLAAFLPGLRPADRAALIARRREAPFPDVHGFLEWAEVVFGPENTRILETLNLAAGSGWFEARLFARLDSIVLRRSATLHRRDGTGRVEMVFSVPEVD